MFKFDDNTFKLYDNSQAKSHIIAVGGGKGGIGRSFISSSLAILLAKMGYKTVLVDLALGAANLHTFLGEGLDSHAFSYFFKNTKKRDLQNVCLKTKIPRLWLIGGSQDDLNISNISLDECHCLITALHEIEADFTILDLGSETNYKVLDFFLSAHKTIVVVTPDPPTIENTYRFMKAAFFRKMQALELDDILQESMKKMMLSCTKFGVRSPADLLFQISKTYPKHNSDLFKFTKNLQFNIILNQVQTLKDVHHGRSIKSVCKKYFGLSMNFLGYIEYNNTVWRSLRKRKPLLIEYPQSHLYSQIFSMARNLACPQEQPSMLEWDFKVS